MLSGTEGLGQLLPEEPGEEKKQNPSRADGCCQPHGCEEDLSKVPRMGWKESLEKKAPSWETDLVSERQSCG